MTERPKVTEKQEWDALAEAVRQAGDPPDDWPTQHHAGEGGKHSDLLAVARALLRRFPKQPGDPHTAAARYKAVRAMEPWLQRLKEHARA